MLGFVTSLRAKALASDWAYHVWLLERTLDSFLAQTDGNLRVAVVCHDVPEVPQRSDPRVQFIPVSFPLPQREFFDMTVDKVLKISLGSQWAIDQGCDYIMYADADDLVSCRLNEFVTANSTRNGWYFERGYVYRYGNRWLRRSQNHNLICGTCAIVKSSLMRFEPRAEYRGERVETLAAAGHDQYRRILEEQGTPLDPLPFAGAIYVLHPDSTVSVWDEVREAPIDDRPFWHRSLSYFRRSAHQARRLRWVSTALRREFAIPGLSAIPRCATH